MNDTQQLPEIPEAEARERNPHLVPWIVVGAVVVAALIASMIVINVVRGAQQSAEGTPSPTPTESEPSPTPSEPEGDDDEDAADDGVPDVEVGEMNTLPIDPWGATSEISGKFGYTTYNIEGENLVLSSDLIEALPDACADMRGQWGATRAGDSYEVLKPGARCEEAPELYDELWGLTAAFVDTIRPA